MKILLSFLSAAILTSSSFAASPEQIKQVACSNWNNIDYFYLKALQNQEAFCPKIHTKNKNFDMIDAKATYEGKSSAVANLAGSIDVSYTQGGAWGAYGSSAKADVFFRNYDAMICEVASKAKNKEELKSLLQNIYAYYTFRAFSEYESIDDDSRLKSMEDSLVEIEEYNLFDGANYAKSFIFDYQGIYPPEEIEKMEQLTSAIFEGDRKQATRILKQNSQMKDTFSDYCESDEIQQ